VVFFGFFVVGGGLEYGILGYDVICFLMFANVWRNMLPPSSRWP